MKKDLTQLNKYLEKVIQAYVGTEKPVSMAITFTLPPDYDRVFYVSNVKNADSILLFEAAAEKIKSKGN